MLFKKIALIPAYEPGEEMLNMVKDLYDLDFYIVIVDDGSGHDYDLIFEAAELFAHVLHHDVNMGKGCALKTGMKYIEDNFEEPYSVVTADADGQHKVEDILKVAQEAEKYPDMLILGGRQFDGKVPLRSKIGNSITRLVYRIISGENIYDTQTGLRAFGYRLLPTMLLITGERYEYEMNMLMEIPKKKIRIKEVPIKTVYLSGNSSSHFNTLRDSFRIYKEIFKYSLSSFVSFLADYGLFCILSMITGTTVLANVLARIGSATLNFGINRKFVFRSNQRIAVSAVKYFALAAVVLLFNTIILKALSLFIASAYVAKIITELILFVFSYVIQHKFVFKREVAPI